MGKFRLNQVQSYIAHLKDHIDSAGNTLMLRSMNNNTYYV